MTFLLCLLIGLLVAGYYYVKKRYRYWNDRGFASPPSVFLLGSMKGIGTSIHECEGIDVIYKKYKGKAPAVGIFFFLRPTILPLDPELYKNVLVRDFGSFHDRGFYFDKEGDPLSAK